VHNHQTWVARVWALVALCGLTATPGLQAAQIPQAAAIHSSLHDYAVPAVTLLDQHGQAVRLDKALTGSEPVLVQFFFTTCTTICGVRSAQLCAIAPKLAKAGVSMRFYSISIDPESDTPEHLLAYSREFGIPPANWNLVTGSASDIKKVQAAFDASDPSADRMMHRPLTFIHGGKGKPWIRIDGVTSTRQLMQQIEAAVATAH